MTMLTMTNDNDVASEFKVTIHILFIFGRIIVLIIRIRPNSKELKTPVQYSPRREIFDCHT